MMDDENNRLKGLLIATTTAYLLSWVLAYFLVPYLFDDLFLLWMLEYPWLVYLSYLLIFLAFCWIPLTVFLLIQGIILKKKYSEYHYTGDKTVGNLSVLLPIVFISIYVLTRFIYWFHVVWCLPRKNRHYPKVIKTLRIQIVKNQANWLQNSRI